MAEPDPGLTLQGRLPLGEARSKLEVPGHQPLYGTSLGDAYVADSLAFMRRLPDATIDLALTSPPYALHFKKEYGNQDKSDYVEWLLPFAREVHRVLRPDGSFILNIGGSYNQGVPTRSLYHFKLLIELVENVGFHLAQECFWHNPAKMPMPAEWVTVRRIRVRDSVEYVWWLSKGPWPKANNRNVLRAYSKDMERLNRRGLRATVRPSGHHVKSSFGQLEAGGSIPSNVIEAGPEEWAADFAESMLKFGNNAANDVYTKKCKEHGLKIHPARFPAALPEFFLRLLTEEGDYVLDPFAGSNTTGAVAESLARRWLAVELERSYLEPGRFRFL